MTDPVDLFLPLRNACTFQTLICLTFADAKHTFTVYLCIKWIKCLIRQQWTQKQQRTCPHEARSFCIYMCVFVCVWMPQRWGDTGAFLIVRCSLFQLSFVLTRLATPLRFKEGPVSRLKIAGLRMRTRGFPTCKMHSSLFFISSLSSTVSKLFLMRFPGPPLMCCV